MKLKLAVPSLLLLRIRSIHVTAASEANAMEPINGTAFAPNINYSRLMPRGLTEARAESIAPPQQKIVGDIPTSSAVDYMIGLGDSKDGQLNVVRCGGTLIAPRFVLTSADCASFLDRAFVNLYDVTDSTGVEVFEFGFDDIVIHPGWDRSTLDNDIALIRLPQDVPNADNIQYPELNKKSNKPADGDSLLVMGWGGTSGFNNVLRKAEVDYVTNEECSFCYDPIGYSITDGKMCAGGGGKGACDGDKGGPLMLNDGNSDFLTNPVLAGIVVLDYGCGDAPGVYTRVSHYADWIKKQVKCARNGNGAFCPCSGSDEYLMILAVFAVSWEVVNTCGDVPTTIKSGTYTPFPDVSCVPKGQYEFYIQELDPTYSSGYFVKYGNESLSSGALSGGRRNPGGNFKSPATHVFGSCSKSKAGKSRAPKADKTTIQIQASLNESGASYPGPGGLIGVVLALKVLIVCLL